MIELRKYSRDMDFSCYDYVCEDADDFNEMLPFLVPKLDGEWRVMLLEPKLSDVRAYLDTSIVPSYISLIVAIEESKLSQLYMERPQLVKKEKSSWERYIDLIATFPSLIDDKAMREIYRRCGPKEVQLREALDTLAVYSHVTVREVNKHFAPVMRVYANQVVRAFLLGKYKSAWHMLDVLESDLGTTVTFYAMRKNIRHLMVEKSKYLRNENIADNLVAKADGYSIILLYWLFESATNPLQLRPVLYMFERRIVPC